MAASMLPQDMGIIKKIGLGRNQVRQFTNQIILSHDIMQMKYLDASKIACSCSSKPLSNVHFFI